MTHFDWVSAGSVKLVKTENGAGKLRPPPRNLFNQQMPVWELSADCCQSLHQSHFVFRAKDDMWLDELAKGSWILFFYIFFEGPRSRDMSLYLSGAASENMGAAVWASTWDLWLFNAAHKSRADQWFSLCRPQNGSLVSTAHPAVYSEKKHGKLVESP